ncbi:rho GTPase-activating protein 20-like [Elephas maximus indicus]|uniref:rho GTPase-activating protein 20-like n=1 Tax=Elephas maximus indicus TaxID=99487 RepID=UPI002116A4F8|nr:rho GTPase-activating protein 20-like [Elephas maximus indicus]
MSHLEATALLPQRPAGSTSPSTLQEPFLLEQPFQRWKDMLFFINQKGPLTEGIFRILASVRACGALKEKLSSGEKVNFDNESLLVVATVLKDFFRNLQESLFLSDLYCQWLAVIDQGSEEEKITAIQRACRPTANAQCCSSVVPFWSVTQH